MKCLVCGYETALPIGIIKPYIELQFTVYDCSQCGCRFVERDNSIYEKLHSNVTSPYFFQERLAAELKKFFDKGDTLSLRKELSKASKFKFVIDTIEKMDDSPRMLEFGCSKGYLTSYFIARGYDILGVDISETAINFATDLFGRHFGTLDSPEIAKRSPYDVIFHVGTIGCVESPIETTERLLSLLKPGGKLFFNSPNVAFCKALDQLWAHDTQPPDLVTLFSERFWKEQFTENSDTQVICKTATGYTNIMLFLNQLFKSKDKKSPPSLAGAIKPRMKSRTGIVRNILRPLIDFAGSLPILPQYPDPFGLYVIMTKRDQ